MEGCLVIVPTKRRIRHLTREIMRLAPGAVAPALALHTLESFCRCMYPVLPGARYIVGGPSRTLLFQESVKSAAQGLRYFAVRAGGANLPRGTFDRLFDVIITLKESGIYPGALEDELAVEGPEDRPKLADVATVYAAYERGMEALAVDDLEGMYRHLATGCSREQFQHAFRTLFPDVETVSLAGFDEFSLPEIGILRKLSAVPGLSLMMMFDFLKGNPGLFGHLEENYRLLTELGFRETRSENDASSAAFFFGFTKKPAPARDASEHLARTLFRRDQGAPPADLSSLVTVMAARNRVQEVELICKLIKRLVTERPGRDIGAVCVALHRPQLYTDIMREQFARYEIPVNITDRYELARSPLVVTLLGLLALPLRGFRREDVLRVIGSPSIAVPTNDTAFDAGNLSAVASRVRATAGIRSWNDRLERSVAWAERTRAASAGEAETRRAADDVRSFRKGQSDLGALERLAQPFMEPMTAAEFEERFLTLLDLLSVPRLLIDTSLRQLPELMEKDIRAFTSLRDVLREITGVAGALEGSGGRSPLAVHYDRLRAAIGRERYNIRERFGRGVLVTSIEETRELPVDVMIVAGLVDGEFPSAYQPEIFLSARRRRKREQRHVWQNRYLFYQAVTNWTEELYLTYPFRDAGIDLVRSSFVDALQKCARVRLWDSDGRIPLAHDFGAREDFLRSYGAASLTSPDAAPPVPPGLEEECALVLHAADVERSRAMSHRRREYEGIIGADPDVQQILSRMSERVFSVSQLETYATCPYRFFARTLLRLASVDEFEEELSAAEKGSVLHETLFEFFRSRRDRGLPLLCDLTEDEFARAAAEAVAIAAAKLDDLDIPGVFWDIEKELILGGPGDAGIVRRFLEFERARTEPVRPSYFEVSFGGTPGGGRDSELTRSEPVPIGSFRLRGKVDRIDTGDGFFTIVDYKTGRNIPGLKEIREGMSLQLPLYLDAVEELMRDGGPHGLVPAGGLYYRLREVIELRPGVLADEFRGRAFPASARHRQLVRDQRELRELIDGARRTAETLIGKMTAGEFPLTRPELITTVCATCEFRTMCRIQTMRHVPPIATEGE